MECHWMWTSCSSIKGADEEDCPIQSHPRTTYILCMYSGWVNVISTTATDAYEHEPDCVRQHTRVHFRQVRIPLPSSHPQTIPSNTASGPLGRRAMWTSPVEHSMNHSSFNPSTTILERVRVYARLHCFHPRLIKHARTGTGTWPVRMRHGARVLRMAVRNHFRKKKQDITTIIIL